MATDQKRTDVEAFNLRAETYEDSHKQSIIFDRVQKAVLELAKDAKPQTILDVGCGTGRLLRKTQTFWPNAQLIGVDPAEAMITQAMRLFPKGKFYVAMAESLPLPDQSVDVVFSTLSYHHWADQDKGVNQIARILRSGGKFILADIVMPMGLTWIFRHAKRNSKKKIRETFSMAGLKVTLQQRRLSLVVITAGEKQ